MSRMSTLLIKHLCWWNAQCVKRYKEKSYFKVIHNSLVFFCRWSRIFQITCKFTMKRNSTSVQCVPRYWHVNMQQVVTASEKQVSFLCSYGSFLTEISLVARLTTTHSNPHRRKALLLPVLRKSILRKFYFLVAFLIIKY